MLGGPYVTLRSGHQNLPNQFEVSTWDLVGNRLTQERETDGNLTSPEETITYDYDDPSTPTTVADPNDRLFGETRIDHATSTAITITYGYTGRDPGSLTTETTDAGGGGGGGVVTREYAHDLRGRLVSADPDGDGPAGDTTYTYGSHGRRVSETADGDTTYLLVDTNSPTGYSQVLQEYDILGGTPKRSYVQGHAILAQGYAYLLRDGHAGGGSVRLLTQADGTVVEAYDYEAFGTPLFDAGTAKTVHGYNNERYDADLGLYDQRTRLLNPTSGRFTWRDNYIPTAGDFHNANLYSYVAGNAVNAVDPTGEFGLTDVLASSGIQSMLSSLQGSVYQSVQTVLAGMMSGLTANEILGEVLLDQFGLLGDAIRFARDVIEGEDYWVHYGEEENADVDGSDVVDNHSVALRSRVASPSTQIFRVAKVYHLTKQQKQLIRMIRGAAKAAPGGLTSAKGAAHGSRAHGNFAGIIAGIRSRQGVDLWDEISYLNGRPNTGASPAGSVRLDVVLGQMGQPEMIFDLKTGSAKLTAARVREIRTHLPQSYQAIPIVGIRI